MSETQIVLHPKLPNGVEAYLREISDVVLTFPKDDNGVIEALNNGGQVLVTYTWRDAFLTPSLKWIAGTGAGYEQYPLELLNSSNVVLTTAAGAHSDCVAEHAFGLMLTVTRRIKESVQNMRKGHWQPLVGEELAGKNLAIIGLGRIGEAVALRAQNWGLSIVGVKRNPDQYQGCLSVIRTPDHLAEVCEWADILLLATPASPDGSPIIGQRELDLLGAGWIFNVGRGNLIDESALIHALKDCKLKGAGLDVTAVEPLPLESELWSLPNVVVSAHNAAAGPGYGIRWGAIFRQNLSALSGVGDWVNCVTKNQVGQS